MRRTLVIQYGLPRCVEGQDVVEEQISRAHRYANRLVELERSKRQVLAEIQARADSGDAIGAKQRALERLDRAKAELAEAKQGDGPVPASLRAAVREARVAYRDAAEALREAKRRWSADPAIVAQYAAASEAQGDLARRLRAESGVYWGTYLLVEAAHEQIRRSPAEPRFRAWSGGSGRVGVQIPRGIPWSRVLSGEDTRMRVEPIHDDGRAVSRRHDPARGVGRSVLWLRVGSHDDRSPVWARWQVVIHRAIPPDALVKWAVVVRRREPWRDGAARYRDTLHLTVEAAMPEDARIAADRSRTVALDIGWRRLDDGSLRVAAWYDSAGGSGTYVLSRDDCEASLERSASLRAIRDRKMDEMRARLAAWSDGVTWPAAWPDRLIDRMATLGLWRSPQRFAQLFRVWSRERFPGDAVGYEILRQWWAGDEPRTAAGDHGDRHLWEWESNCRQTAVRRRRDLYRRWSAEIARTHSRIVIERFDLRAVKQRPAVDETEHVRAAPARSQMHFAAVGEFRALLLRAAESRGCEVVEVEAAGTTRTCSRCGADQEWDQAEELVHTCTECGETWDQDEGAARNILARERSDGARIVVAARTAGEDRSYAGGKGGRWQRRKAEKRDRSRGGS